MTATMVPAPLTTQSVLATILWCRTSQAICNMSHTDACVNDVELHGNMMLATRPVQPAIEEAGEQLGDPLLNLGVRES